MEFLILILLIGLNGLFAMSELAVVSSRKARLKARSENGDRGAEAALALQADASHFLATVQIGITLIGVIAGAFGATAVADDLAAHLLRWAPGLQKEAGAIALGATVILTAYLSLVVGELAPKRIALIFPEAIAAVAAPPLRLLAKAAFPAVWLLRASTEGVLRLIGLHRARAGEVTEEEIHAVIAEGATAGVIEAGEQHMLRGVMRLADRDVRSIMTPRLSVVWLDLNDPPEQLLKKIVASGHSRFPVAKGDLDEVLGVVQAKDILASLGPEGRVNLRAAMRPAVLVPETLTVTELLNALKNSEIRMALILDEHGLFEGLATAADVFGAIAGASAYSPSDRLAAPARRADGSWLIDGMTPILDIDAILGAPGLADKLMSEDYATIAGLVVGELQRLAEVGDVVEKERFRFEVMDMDGRRIDKILLSRIEDADTDRD
jgi:putative hemolysin